MEAIATTLNRFAKGRKKMGDFVNNSEDKEENKQLSLFEVSQEFKEEKLDKKERVDNFCLYASERSRLKLEEILELW